METSDPYTLGVVASLTLVELLGDSAMKMAADLGLNKLNNTVPLLTGMASYALLSIIIYTSDSLGLLWGVSNSYWNAINNLVTPLVFMLWFGETYTAMQWVGFAVISFGILLVGFG